ncbi:MAG: sigma-70 family RNA polymerase sigma factor [Balneolaceae bacterium]|nr:sigma-70 family RNA polymerase sigma factor [Balneolaceae bacterium]
MKQPISMGIYGKQVSTKHGKEKSYQCEDLLWIDIQNGNEEALADLFLLYYDQLFNYGIKIIGNTEFIKDCIQELFLTIWDRRNYINEAYSVKSYLLSSLRRTVFRKLKKSRAIYDRNQKYAESFSQEVLNVEELMVYFEVKKEKKIKLEKAITQLGGRQKEVIYLKFYDGLSNAEIADVMGINRQSVYNHVSGAIQSLQEFIT